MSLYRNRHHNKIIPVAIILVVLLIPSICMAGAPTFGASGGLEVFHLKELDNTGARLVSESGNRYVVTAFLDDGDIYDFATRFYYHLEASIYWGQVDYDGKSQSFDSTQNNLPLNSNTDYLGGRSEALLGYRFKILNRPRAMEIIGGIGIDGWNRNIQSATTSNGTVVSGIEETYYVYYGKIGLGLSSLVSSTWHGHLQVGLKMPFNITEDVHLSKVGYDSDLTLSPGNSYSGFVNFLLEQPSKNKSGNLLIGIYYDGFRFDPSKAKTVTSNGSPTPVLQPETHIDIFGFQIGYRF